LADELAAMSGDRIAGGRSGADGIEPPLRSFGPLPGARGCGCRHRGARASAQPVPVVDAMIAATTVIRNAQLARSP
jgi:hypothetical protein